MRWLGTTPRRAAPRGHEPSSCMRHAHQSSPPTRRLLSVLVAQRNLGLAPWSSRMWPSWWASAHAAWSSLTPGSRRIRRGAEGGAVGRRAVPVFDGEALPACKPAERVQQPGRICAERREAEGGGHRRSCGLRQVPDVGNLVHMSPASFRIILFCTFLVCSRRGGMAKISMPFSRRRTCRPINAHCR